MPTCSCAPQQEKARPSAALWYGVVVVVALGEALYMYSGWGMYSGTAAGTSPWWWCMPGGPG